MSKLFSISIAAALSMIVFQNCSEFSALTGAKVAAGGTRSFASGESSAVLLEPFDRRSSFWFVPNQLAGNAWYKVNEQLINGHIEGSFSNLDLWPNLIQLLLPNSGGLGLYAAEIGYTSDETLAKFRRNRIATSVEAPGWTQCLDGHAIANLELHGRSPGEVNLFESIFVTKNAPGRADPEGRGWFVTRDGSSYAPEEIILDERMPNLFPWYKNEHGELYGVGTWEQRKAAAKVFDPCAAHASFNPGLDRATGFVYDYVEYARVMRAKLPTTDFSFHWNVNPGWEWRDLQCLEGVNARHPTASDFQQVYQHLREPCHLGTDLLIRTVQAICADAKCPKAVYMDVDFVYNTAYSLDVLRRNKQALANLGIDFGINLVNQCDSVYGQGSTINVSADGQSLICVQRNATNAANEESMLNLVQFFISKGVIDASTRLRVASWSKFPAETGIGVNEGVANGMAATTNRIFNEILVPRHLANPPSASYQPTSGTRHAAGFFRIGEGGIYVSNGNDAYCGVSSWDDFIRFGGQANLSNVAQVGGLPNGMRADPQCR